MFIKKPSELPELPVPEFYRFPNGRHANGAAIPPRPGSDRFESKCLKIAAEIHDYSQYRQHLIWSGYSCPAIKQALSAALEFAKPERDDLEEWFNRFYK